MYYLNGPALDGIFWTFHFHEFRKWAVEVWNFFGKNLNFQTRKIFAKNFGNKFRNLSSEKSSDINRNCTSILKISKSYVKFEFLSQKTLFLGQKVWKKFGKSSGKSLEKLGNTVFRTFGNFGNCFIPKFPKITKKMMLNLNFENREKLVPTRKFS